MVPVNGDSRFSLQSTGGGKTNASTGSTGALYCTCRGPYTGEFMISCDRCSEWYHGRCVGISPQEDEEWENQDYICSGCKTQKSKPEPPQASTNPTGLRRSARRKGSIRDVQRRECWRQPKEELGAAEEKGPNIREERGADRDAHSAPPLGRGFQVKKETTQERKRRRNRQKERLANEAARLRRALRDAQERQTPQSGSRGREGVSAPNIFQQGGGRRETGVSRQTTPQRSYTAKGTGMSEQRTPRGNFTVRETGLSSQRTPQHDYTLRETGVSGQRTPQYDNTPRERDLPTLQSAPSRVAPRKS
ncbi:unnamed protein product [Mytilus coruscus]|uniref:PHD-type domain-containing protein n=1 Tax=Mytilus coruscus TaxID=42192 RepID=A0A6J8E7K6_MYTCO|nr:unnamed protein product [Mytilus coruscus]